MVTFLYTTLFDSDFSPIQPGPFPKWAKLPHPWTPPSSAFRTSVNSWPSWFADQWSEWPCWFSSTFKANYLKLSVSKVPAGGIFADFPPPHQEEFIKHEKGTFPWELHAGDSLGIPPSSMSRGVPAASGPLLCAKGTQSLRGLSSGEEREWNAVL